MADVERKTKRYPADLTDAEWAVIQPLLPKAPKRGRKPGVDMREVLNAIRCMARSGGGWRMLPIHFGPWLKHLFADGAYDRGKLMDKAAFRDFVIEIVRRTDKEPGFKVIPRRWVVERTFGWMVRWRRPVRDYERDPDASEAMIHVAMGALLIRRVAHPWPFSNGL